MPDLFGAQCRTLPRRCVLLFGQEGPGLSDPARAACTALFSIAQYGSTRSINAGVLDWALLGHCAYFLVMAGVGLVVTARRLDVLLLR